MTAAFAFDTGPRWTRQRTLAASGVFAAHLLLLWAIWQLKQLGQAHRPERVSVPIRFVQERPPKAAPAPKPERAPAMVAVQAPAIATPAEPAMDAAASPGSDTSPGATGPSGAPAAAPGTLTLKPSREVMLGSLSNPAVNDPRSNTPKPTFEERVAMGLDPGLCVKLERLPNGEVRRRMGRMVNAQSAIQNTYGVGPFGIQVCE